MPAAKSILEVEVNSDSFQDFLAQFKDYEKALEVLPEQWKQVGEELKAAVETFGNAAEGAAALGAAMGAAANNQARFHRETMGADKAMGSLWHHAKSVASTVGHIAKWMTIGGGLSGLATGLGLWGIDRLANSVFGQRRTAQGLGVTTGERSAFATNYRQYVDPDSLLGNVANARNDIGKWWTFGSLGLDPNSKMGNAEMAREVMRRAREVWQQGPHTQQYAESKGLLEFFSMEELRRLGAVPNAEFNKYDSQYGKDVKAFTLPDDVQRQWVWFSRQLRASGIVIETSLIRGLAHLTPPLTKLTGAVANAISAFLNSDAVKKAINWLADTLNDPKFQKGIDDFVTWLGSPEFSKDLEDLGAEIRDVVRGIGKAILDIEGIATRAHDWLFGPDKAPDLPGADPNLTLEQRQILQEQYERFSRSAEPTVIPPSRGAIEELRKEHPGTNVDMPAWQNAIHGAATKYGAIPENVLWNLFGAESNFGHDLVSPAGALGGFQLMPGTTEEISKLLGRKIDPFNPNDASEGATAYLYSLYTHYGSLRKAIAAYNWGPAKLDKDIAEHGEAWEQFVPPETKRELATVFPEHPTGQYRQVTLGGAPQQTPPTPSIGKQLREHGQQAPASQTPTKTPDTAGYDATIAQALERIRKQLAKPSSAKVALSVTGDVAARVAVTGSQVAF